MSTGHRSPARARPPARERITRAALRLLVTGGNEAFQMRKVAAQAGVSTRTLHKYFPTKDYLLLTALTEHGQGLDWSAGNNAPAPATPLERVISVLRVPTDALQAFPEVARPMVAALLSADPRSPRR